MAFTPCTKGGGESSVIFLPDESYQISARGEQRRAHQMNLPTARYIRTMQPTA